MSKRPSRDRLSRLGDKLDTADVVHDDKWLALYDEYAALALARALSARPPNVKFNSPGSYWTACATLWAVADRARALAAERDIPHSFRATADLDAAYAAAYRDWQVVAQAKRDDEDRKAANKQKAIAIAKARRQRVRGIAKAIHSAIWRAMP